MITTQTGIGKPELVKDSLLVRNLVFQQEQGIPFHLDDDGTDINCFIVVIYDQEQPVGTGRLSLKENQIARIAVLPEHRGKGYSFQILDLLESYAQEQDLAFVKLTPHLDLLAYYGKRGYEEVSDSRFSVAGHDLTVMTKSFQQ